MLTQRLEASVIYSICTQLENLGWTVDESDPHNNVTQQRAKTEAQKEKLRDASSGTIKFPDFVLYESGTTSPIAIIEAKRPGQSLDNALAQAVDLYATPLNTPLVFAYNDTYVESRHVAQNRSLKIDGEDIRQFVDHYTALRFVHEGPEILAAPQSIQVSREELIRIFKRQANLLREAGLQAGLERFGAFSDVLFLKLMDELCQLREHAGEEPVLPPYLRWSGFQDRHPEDRLQYVREVVWEEMNRRYGAIFSNAFPIQSAEIFDDMVNDLSKLNFTGTDVDVKGDAFEYFLKNAYQGITIKDLGEYFTPRNIVRTMVSMVDPKFGETVYDPFCGTGGFLIEAFRYISLRVKPSEDTDSFLKKRTIYGSEIAATARVARMNMILFGDGHNNVIQQDSFANTRHEDFDVVLTNPPYSQRTRYGNLYPVPSKNGDAVAIQHCLESLKPDGRAAILVKEDFLTKGGDIGSVRELLLKSVKNFSVVSLPRRLFEPYTPTKTSIVYFEKAGSRTKTFFYVVRDVGHTFGARRKSTTRNDLPYVLDAFRNEPQTFSSIVDSHAVENDAIEANSFSLWVYDYKEVLPHRQGSLEPLGNHIVKSGHRFFPGDYPDEWFDVLGISNSQGVFLEERKSGREFRQKYIKVRAGDLVYNPHRVNVGSVGMVPEQMGGGIVSNIYVVFRPKLAEKVPPAYLLYLLKSEVYLNIIRAYDTKHGAVRANLNWDQLCRIKIIVPNDAEVSTFLKNYMAINDMRSKMESLELSLTESFV